MLGCASDSARLRHKHAPAMGLQGAEAEEPMVAVGRRGLFTIFHYREPGDHRLPTGICRDVFFRLGVFQILEDGPLPPSVSQ